MKSVKKILDKGQYPLSSKYYKKCHKYANKKEIQKFGTKSFHALQSTYLKHPNEILGIYTPKGKYSVSYIVKRSKVKEVLYHEKQERKCIKKKGKV